MPHFKRMLSLFLALLLCFQLIPVSAVAADSSGSLGNFEKKNVWNDTLFADVAETDWFRENVRSVYEYGLMVGKGEGLFDPSGSVSTAEILTVAARLHAVYHTGSDVFAPTDPWYAGYAAYCAENGIVSSLPEKLNAPAARGLVAEILGAALPETEYEAINSVADGSIPDVAADDVCGPAVYRLYRAGIVVGNDGKGTFAPYSDVKRSEAAAILTRIVDKSLRMSVTLPVPETAPVPSAAPTPGSTNSADDEKWLRFPVWPQKPEGPDDPVDELTAAYRRLAAEQTNCHLRNSRINVLTYRTTSVQYDYDYDGQYIRAVYRDSSDNKEEEYYFRNDSGEVEYGLTYRLGTWCLMDEWAFRYTDFDFPVFPPDIDSSLYEEIEDGWYQVSESVRTEEAARVIQHLSDENTAGTYTVEDFRIQVKDGRVSAMFLAYTKEGWSGTSTHTEIFEFSDFGSIAFDFPENFAVSLTTADLMNSWRQGEAIDGMTVSCSGYVVGFMDNCFILMDITEQIIPVYLEGMDPSGLEIGDSVELIGTIDCGRFRGGVPVIAVGDPDQAAVYYGYTPEIPSSGDDLEDLTESGFDLVDFTCLIVPEIPDEEALKNADYMIRVSDAYGHEAFLYLGDSDTAQQDPDGNAVRFRAELRTYVRELLEASGGSVCELDFTSILLTDGSVFAPIHETEYRKSDGPALVTSPAVRMMLPNPEITLQDALTGVAVEHMSGNGEKTPVLELEYSCPGGFDPAVPGDYEVRVVYRGIELSCTIRILGAEDGVYLDEMTADTLNDLTDQGIYPGASLPAEGDVNILVIPIRFSDSPAYDVDLETAFNSTDHSTGWYSLREYYEEVSFGELLLNARIMPVFETGMDMKTAESTYPYDMAGGIAKLAMAYYDPELDYSQYDQNEDGNIDCVYLVYDAPIVNSRSDWWSYNSFTYGEFDGKELNQYIWISAETFLSDFWISNSTNAPAEDTDGVALNCRILIHETGHALGLQDLYGVTCNPTGDTMMMCSNLGDHDPLSKMILGWIRPAFDYASPQEHLTLRSYTMTGDALIISPDDEQSYFKEYYTVSLYTPEGVNEAFKDREVGLFSKPGLIIYHVRGELQEKYITSISYFKASNNSSRLDKALIRLIQNNGRDTLGDDWLALANDDDLYLPGDSYTFTWGEDSGAPSITMTVNDIYLDENGAWCADITLK